MRVSLSLTELGVPPEAHDRLIELVASPEAGVLLHFCQSPTIAGKLLCTSHLFVRDKICNLWLWVASLFKQYPLVNNPRMHILPPRTYNFCIVNLKSYGYHQQFNG